MTKVSRKPFSFIDQHGADPTATLLGENLEVSEQGAYGEVPTDLVFFGKFQPDVHDPQWSSVITCDQKNPPTFPLTS